MESFLSDYLLVFQYLTLPGFFYLIGVLLLMQSYTTIKPYEIVKNNGEFMFYISILVLVFSFIIGLIIFLAEQEFFALLLCNRKPTPKPGLEGTSLNNLYSVLIMIRHLILSIVFLVFSTAIYLKKNKKSLPNKVFFSIIYSILISILALAYFKMKYLMDCWKIDGQNSVYWILFDIVVPYTISLFYLLQDPKETKVDKPLKTKK